MAKRERRRERVELVPEGIRVGAEVVALFVASVHYWRLETRHWRPALDAVKSLGFRIVDTYVPWSEHETAPGEFDFGRLEPSRDVARFVRLCGELGLYVIVRPGPHINAELTCFGIPERVVWDDGCQAKSPEGKPVILPVPPHAFPVPSYASETFHSEVARWFMGMGAELRELVYPDGPIVLLQIDNEGAFYFRDGVYDQDYHPDAIEKYRRFLAAKYVRVSELRTAHRDAEITFARAEPPRSFSANAPEELTLHLDWAEFQEHMLAEAFTLFKKHLDEAGLGGLPTSHNLPLGEGATPLDPERVGKAVDLVGLDYYHGASAPQRSEIARRTSELAVRSEARGHPAFACELGAGFPPFFPPLAERDSVFTVLTALAYGLRGFNAYMAVERDRWIGSPVDREGRIRASAEPWRKLLAALERTRFFELTRPTPVHVVVPRSFRRLGRVCHAFGPLSAALFQVIGSTLAESCFEDEFGLGSSVLLDTDRFVRGLEHELTAQNVPYALVGGDILPASLERARWVVVACPGALELPLSAEIERAWWRGSAVSVGPHPPERDAAFRPRSARLRVPPELGAPIPALLSGDTNFRELVENARTELELGTLEVTPREVFATLHEDRRGRARVLFLINPTEWAHECHVKVPGVTQATDALDASQFRAEGDVLCVPVPGLAVRMLEITHGS
jgi:beta-galactosidase